MTHIVVGVSDLGSSRVRYGMVDRMISKKKNVRLNDFLPLVLCRTMRVGEHCTTVARPLGTPGHVEGIDNNQLNYGYPIRFFYMGPSWRT